MIARIFRPINIFIFFAGLLIIGGLFVLQNRTDTLITESERSPLPTIKVNDVIINIELADTHEKRRQGLSGRVALPERNGMLFLFDKPDLYSFWMKDMQFPHDIIWIDKNYRIADITKNIPPDSFPQAFQPRKPVQYVLEVNAGFAEKNNITIADAVDFLEVFTTNYLEELE